MKNIRHDSDDSMRPEYRRSDFGEMVKGKHAAAEIAFAELIGLLLASIGEDEAVKFIHRSSNNSLAVYKPGDWTYEIDNTNQITLRYWVSEFGSLDESISNPQSVTNAEQRSDLNQVLIQRVQLLKTRVHAL